LKDGSEGSGFIADHYVFHLNISYMLFSANNRSAHYRRKYGFWEICTGKAAFDKLFDDN
jgi:hypothetical protein